MKEMVQTSTGQYHCIHPYFSSALITFIYKNATAVLYKTMTTTCTDTIIHRY
jgi:hypothetical protein